MGEKSEKRILVMCSGHFGNVSVEKCAFALSFSQADPPFLPPKCFRQKQMGKKKERLETTLFQKVSTVYRGKKGETKNL